MSHKLCFFLFISFWSANIIAYRYSFACWSNADYSGREDFFVWYSTEDSPALIININKINSAFTNNEIDYTTEDNNIILSTKITHNNYIHKYKLIFPNSPNFLVEDKIQVDFAQQIISMKENIPVLISSLNININCSIIADNLAP